MGKAQITAVLFIAMLAGAEAARIDAALDLEQTASSSLEWGKSTCAKLKSELDTLGNYLPQKVQKIETKGVGGTTGALRILKLGRKTNALSAAMVKFGELECDGDTTEVRENLAQAQAAVKRLTTEAGEESANLATAMAQVEEKLESLKTKPASERSAYEREIVASFIKTLMGGGSHGEMTPEEESKILGPTDLNTQDILNTAEQEGEQEDTAISMLELDGRMGLALVEMDKVNRTALATGNIFADSLVGLGKILANIVIGVLGCLWFMSVMVFFAGGFIASLLGFVAAIVICFTWWLLGQIVEFVSLGSIAFGKDMESCHRTVWGKPMQAGERTLEWYSSYKVNPFEHMIGMAQTAANVTVNKVVKAARTIS